MTIHSHLNSTLPQEAVEMLDQKGFSTALLQEFGIFYLPSNSLGSKTDLMWERIIVPIHGFHGNTIAYAGRRLDSMADSFKNALDKKYLNSDLADAKLKKWLKSKWINDPYEKSKNIFNIHRAYESALENKFLILVEGYWDVMAFYNKQIYNVISTCGTYLSNFQALFIKAISDHCFLMYDPDDAGYESSEKSIDILNHFGVTSTSIELPKNLDPDEFLKSKKATSIKKIFQSLNEDRPSRISLN